MFHKFILLSLIFTAISCKSYQEPSKENMTIIHQSELTGNGQENIKGSYKVIKTEEDWLALEEKMNSVNDQRIKMEPVDFSNEMLIVLFSEIKRSGGHSIKIKNITQNETDILITVLETSPRGLATTMMTQPYFIAKLPRTEKEINFETVTNLTK